MTLNPKNLSSNSQAMKLIFVKNSHIDFRVLKFQHIDIEQLFDKGNVFICIY